jgi:hypothetical protein
MAIGAGQGIVHSTGENSCLAGKTPTLICIDQPPSVVWPTLVVTLQRRRL